MDTIYLDELMSAYLGLPYDAQSGKLALVHQCTLERMKHPEAVYWPRIDLALIGKGFGTYNVINATKSKTPLPV